MDTILLKSHYSLIALFIASTMAALTPGYATAAVIITIPNVTIAPGGSGSLDVLIHSDNLAGDSFQNYFLDFTISGAAQNADPINFVASIITAPQLTATGPDYIFLGDSAEFNSPIGIDFVTDQPGSPIANDLITVTDLTFSGADRTITSGDGNFLLARLNFIAPLTATQGSVYDISLDASTSFFEDTSLSLLAYSSNIGTITISGAAAVPEPGTFGVLAIGAAGCFYRRLRRKRT